MSNTPRVSVIIPTLNGGRRFKEVLASLSRQSLVPVEILVIDSSSDDDTLLEAEKYKATIKRIARADFDHGGTRSLAAKTACGDLLVYLTQDAVLYDQHALTHLVAPFSNPKVAATFGRQLPHPEANCFARHLRHFNYPEESSVRCWEDRKQYGFKTVFISNSFAAYRKDLLEEVGFFENGLLFGEDTFTLAKLLRKGYCVVYVAEAKIFHSHNYTVCKEFRRYFDIGVLHSVHKDLLAEFGGTFGEGRRFVSSELLQLIKEKEYFCIPESILRNSMKFLAYHLGKRYSFLPRRMAVCCSMNRAWWTKRKY